MSSTVKDVRNWIVETRAIIAEIKTAREGLRRKREEEANVRALAEQEKRGELADLLAFERWGQPMGDLDLAKRVDAFVKEAFEIRGPRDAARILRDESYEAYGRARRTNALNEHFPGINHQGLDWAAGRHIEVVAFWAEFKFDKGSDKRVVVKPSVDPQLSDADLKPVDVGTLDLSGLFGGAARVNKK